MKHFLSLLFGAFFLAGLIAVFEEHEFFTSYIKTLDYLLYSNVRSQKIPEEPTPEQIVVLIDEKRWKNHYIKDAPPAFKITDPINREQLANDIKTVVDKLHPKTIFVDFDFLVDFPEDPASLKQPGYEAYIKLMETLFKLQDSARIFLISPFGNVKFRPHFESIEKNYNEAWSGKSCTKLGLPCKQTSIQLIDLSDLLAPRFDILIHFSPKSQNGLCQLLLPTDKAYPNSLCSEKARAHKENQTINFHKYASTTSVIKLDDLKKYPNSLDAYHGKTIFIGGTFGSKDPFLTPLGQKYGIEMIAAIFTTLKYPFKESHATNYVMDLLLGLLVGIASYHAWKRLIQIQLAYPEIIFVPALFMGAIAIFVLFIVMSLYLLLWFSFTELFIGPIIMSMGMTLHAFILTPYEMIHRHHALPQTPLVNRLIQIIIYLLFVGALAMSFYGLYLVVHHS